MKTRALIIVVFALLVTIAPADAALAFEPLPVSKTDPSNGATAAPKECVRFGLASLEGLEYLENNPEKGLWPAGNGVIVIVAAEDITEQNGILAQGVREEELLLEPGALAGMYSGITCKEPRETEPAAFSAKHLHPGSPWRERPGTHYWQVMAGKGVPGLGEAVQSLLSPIYKFIIVPTPTAKPKAPALTGAQKRAKAVANCEKRYKHKHMRVKCERAARKSHH